MSSIEIKDLKIEYEELSDMELELVAGGKRRSFLMDAVNFINNGFKVGPGTVKGDYSVPGGIGSPSNPSFHPPEGGNGPYVTYTVPW